MTTIHLSDEILAACPELCVLAIECDVINTPHNEELWMLINEEASGVRASVKLEEVNKWKPILATRQAYKRLGKDPNRYRPSAEALRRRILRELPLYQIDTLVDIINLVSIRSGYSIGGFDANKIEGELTLGVGRAEEPYEAIGRGIMNIEGLPVYRDRNGGVGTPTSDEERTKIDLSTTRLLMIINGYSGEEGIMNAGTFAIELLKKYVSASQVTSTMLSVQKRAEVMF